MTGVVRSIAPFGVFVDLGGIDGLVHKSELSWNKVNNPETAYQIGDEVEAEVIDINHERGRISLSIRRLQPDPWQESVAKYKIGDVIDGTVTKLVNFGAFVRVEEGLEGLIHISELSHQRVAHPGDVVQEGQEVSSGISLDSERHRLGLSLKQAEDRPAPAPREERPRRDRAPRRDRFDDRPEDATAEPEGGIDSTMAAAFASSGLLDQFRSESDASEADAPAEAEADPAAEVEAATEPEVAEVAPAAETADEAPSPKPRSRQPLRQRNRGAGRCRGSRSRGAGRRRGRRSRGAGRCRGRRSRGAGRCRGRRSRGAGTRRGAGSRGRGEGLARHPRASLAIAPFAGAEHPFGCAAGDKTYGMPRRPMAGTMSQSVSSAV